jgi:hypothetical protein
VTASDDLDAAEARVEAWFGEFDALPIDAFQLTSLPAPRPDHDRLRAEAGRLAETHGLGELLETSHERIRAAVRRAYDEGGYRATMVGLNWGVSEGTAQDRVAAALAAEDAVTAVVVEPWAGADLVAALASPFELIQRGREVAPSFDLSEATARRVAPLGRGSVVGQVVIAVALVVALVAALTIGSWALAGAAVIIAVVVGGLLVGRRPRDGA